MTVSQKAMSKASFLAGILGIPLLVPLVLTAILTPRYVPSDALRKAAASTQAPGLSRQRILAGFVGRCRLDWALDEDRLERGTTLYSWENDAGLLARTQIHCPAGGACTVTAGALFDWPFPSEIGGKPVPTRIWGCRDRGRIF